MPEAFSTPNLVALSITSKELGRGGFFAPPPTKIVLSNSPTTIGLTSISFPLPSLCARIGLRDKISLAANALRVSLISDI